MAKKDELSAHQVEALTTGDRDLFGPHDKIHGHGPVLGALRRRELIDRDNRLTVAGAAERDRRINHA